MAEASSLAMAAAKWQPEIMTLIFMKFMRDTHLNAKARMSLSFGWRSVFDAYQQAAKEPGAREPGAKERELP